MDYTALGARYEADGRDVLSDAFALATNYSPLGCLFKGEGKYDPDMIRGWKAYPVSTTYARVLFHQRSQIRKSFDLFSRYRGVEGSSQKKSKSATVYLTSE